MKILLITGGSIQEEFAMDFMRAHTFDKIIAVDGGLAFADAANVQPLSDIVGDFDTIAPEILEKYKNMTHGPVIHTYNPQKDNTDTDIALKLAVAYCVDKGGLDHKIWILGATGSRMDHVLANITMLLLPYQAGIRAYIQDANNRISLLHGSTSVLRKEQFGKYVSLIPLTSELSGITLTGVKYPLFNHSVELGDSLCVSNEIIADEAVLTVENGIAILLETRD